MDQASIWTRVGHWFKAAGRGAAADDSLGELSPPKLLNEEEAAPQGDNGSGEMAPLSKRRQREAALEKLQEGYEQVVVLMGSIHTHLQAQDERTQQIADALTTLAETTGRLPEVAEGQSQQLATIATHLEVGNDRARRWEQTLFDLPKLAEAQRDTLESIGRELEAKRHSETRMAETLDGLGGAVQSLGESSTASSRTLKELQQAAAERDDGLHTLMKEQNKRFIWLFVVTLLLAAAAITTGVITMFK